MTRLPGYLTIIWGSFFSILTLASLFKTFYWAFDVLTHFHIQFFIGSGICLVLVFVLRSSVFYKGLFLVTFLLNAYLLLPYFWPPAKPAAENTLRIATLNVFTDNSNYQRISDYLLQADLDMVFFSEIEPALMTHLQELNALYPYVLDQAMEGTHGLALMSKYPFQGETIPLDERHHRFLKASLEWQGHNMVIYAAHPHPPLAARWTKSRNDELSIIQGYLQQESNPHIFLGDLNASPWSKPMQELFKQTRLSHAAKGFGIYPTWRYKTMLLGAPLDHILVSPEWEVVHYRLEGDIDSDHFPVVAEISLPNPRTE